MCGPHNKVGVNSVTAMETRFIRNGAIKTLAIISVLMQATYSENATNSTITSLTSSNSSLIKNSTKLVSLTITPLNSTETLETSKKDKRQAQRGYTDIPLDERSLDEVTNSSPPPFLGFESDLPPLAEKSNNDLSISSTYLPKLLDRKPDSSFFSPRLGFPANLPKLDDVPAAATSIIERRDDFFDTSGDGKPIPGEAGRDYPTFSSIPSTSFSCKDQAWPGYYADTEARCQVFWICQKHRMDAFLCPNGTLFNQQVFVCDWWFNVDCNEAPSFYTRNQYLYAGPGVGIDGQPTRHRSFSSQGSSGAANTFVNAVVPKPINSNNGYVNQVQSSNQVARVASIGITQVSRQQSPPSPPPPSQVSNNYNNNQQNQNYLASSSQEQPKLQQQTHNNQNHVQYTGSHKYTSNQNMLSNRMQKSPTNPTDRPSSPIDNSFTGGYQQQHQSNQNQYHQSASNDVARRTLTNSGQNQILVEYHTNRSVSTTQRPENVPIHTSSRPINTSQRPNVNVEPKGNKQQPIITFSGTISSTARPVSINTEIPSYNHGSSTLQTPKDFGNVNQRQNNGYQNFNQNNNGALTTSAPITTTFRSTSTTYSGTMRLGVVPQNHQPQPSPNPNPNNVGNRQVGSIGSLQPPPPLSTPTSSSSNKFDQAGRNYGQTGFIPTTPTPVISTLRPPGLDVDNQRYVDRFGFVQNAQPNQRTFVSSTTPQPVGYSSTEKGTLFLGQRSNQYTNYNGQREIMYSPSTLNANIEYPYSPSQQKNKQQRLELETLKSLRTQAKDFFAYPHFHGQRSNAYSDVDKFRDDNRVNVDFDQTTPQTRPYHQLPGENTHAVKQFPIAHSTVQPQVTQIHQHHQQQIHRPTPNPNPPGHHQNSANPQQHNFVTTSPHKPHHFVSPTPHSQIQQNTPQHVHFDHASQNSHQQHLQGNGHSSSQNGQNLRSINEHQIQNQRSPQHQQFQQNNQPQQFHKQVQPQQQFHQIPSQSQQSHQTQNAPHQQQQQQPSHQHHQLSPTASPSTPFHQRIIQIPSQNLQLPFLQDQSRDGYTALKSGSFVSIATTVSPAFSRQILSHKLEQAPGSHKIIKSNVFPSPTPPPNGLNYSPSPVTIHQIGQISTTMRPPHPNSTPSPFSNEPLSSSPNKVSPTPFTNQNLFIAAPTQSSISSTSPGHRQNSYLPHNHGKRNKQQPNHHKQQHEGQRSNHAQRIQYPNSAITTTIKYPEGTASLKVGVPGATSTKRLVDFSYSAYPKSATKSATRTTPFPTALEQFSNIVVSSTTRRPPSSPSPQYRETHRAGPGKRLAGAVLNKSTSSSSAIYVDTSVVAESVSTPVSVAPAPTAAPAVSTSNFGLRISTMAKKRMANAWQNYFGSGEKGGGSTTQSSSV